MADSLPVKSKSSGNSLASSPKSRNGSEIDWSTDVLSSVPFAVVVLPAIHI